MRQVDIGIAQTAGVDFHYHLIRASFRGFPLLYFPLAVYGRDNCCFHEEDSRVISNVAVTLDAGAPFKTQNPPPITIDFLCMRSAFDPG
jgi:hypothetical protein